VFALGFGARGVDGHAADGIAGEGGLRFVIHELGQCNWIRVKGEGLEKEDRAQRRRPRKVNENPHAETRRVGHP